ncbi:MAG: AraC family transcriptional regulator [Desulfovibrionaceae bacterium]|nr:AraC family transcriptional regulator [Desulfovibrionaceae bacterium]
MEDSQHRIARLNQELCDLLLERMDHPGIFPTAIEGLNLVRREDATASENCFERPLTGLVVRGVKHSVMSGAEFVYSANQTVVAGVDMPISSWVDGASPEEPFLFLYLYLDRQTLSSLAMEMGPVPDGPLPGSVSVADADADILETFLRLVELSGRPGQIPFRAPLMLRELHYLLLAGPHGRTLRFLHTPGTQNSQVARAVSWIRENFRAPMRVDELAREVCMSAASLHRNFKRLTGLSPLQYQKQLRLFEAQRLMLQENERASSAALTVGYESVTQFNREYKRHFGEPPLRDMARRRALAV